MMTRTGISANGLPYACIGDRPEKLIIFNGLTLCNRAPRGLALKALAWGFKQYAARYTVYLVNRKTGLPTGCSAKDMADDYADMIQRDIGEAVHIMGFSSGGSTALHFAADHPEWTKKLVVAIAAYRLSESGRATCWRWRDLGREERRRELYADMGATLAGVTKRASFLRMIFGLLGPFLLGSPKSLEDFVVTLEADLNLDLADKLSRIDAPTLVIGGTEDHFYSDADIRHTADTIPDARLKLFEGEGHSLIKTRKRDFDKEVLAFLAGRSNEG
jgi:pimeloyl-ACP methyl ester carboxylesterase